MPVESISSPPGADSPKNAVNRSPAVPILVGAGAVLALVAGVLYQRLNAFDRITPPGKIPVGVTIAGVAVGGLSPEDADGPVRQWVNTELAKPIVFQGKDSGRRWNLPLYAIGARYEWQEAVTKAQNVGKDISLWTKLLQADRPWNTDITPAFRIDESAIRRTLARIALDVDRAPVDATARIADNGHILLAHPETKGISLDIEATKTALLKEGPETLRKGAVCSLIVREELPRVNAADLGKMTTLLASFTTDYSSSTRQRCHNVELAAAKINGSVLAPGDEFSYNRTVGKRDAGSGWQSALMFQDGEVVPSLGGGICQVASTLYNAVLRADLKVTERRNHSIKVHYVEPGRDATVVYGAQDFRFANSTPGPIIVLARTRNRTLTINIFGPGPKPKDTIELASGPYRNNELGGITVATYRVIRHADGSVTREYLHTDSYRAVASASDSLRKRTRPERRPAPATVTPTSTRQQPAPAAVTPAA